MGRQTGAVGLVGSFRPNAPPHRFARDSRRRYGQVLSSWIERPGEPPTRISHPGRRSETWAPTRMETPPVVRRVRRVRLRLHDRQLGLIMVTVFLVRLTRAGRGRA